MSEKLPDPCIVGISSLEHLSGHIRKKFLNCPFDDCGCGLSHAAKHGRLDETKDWLLHVVCIVCNRSWSLCRVCRITKVMTNDSQVSRHTLAFHRATPPRQRKKKRILEVALSSGGDCNLDLSPPYPSLSSLNNACVGPLSLPSICNNYHNNFNLEETTDQYDYNPLCETEISAMLAVSNSTTSSSLSRNPFIKLLSQFGISDTTGEMFHPINSKSVEFFLAKSRGMGCNYLAATAHNGKTGVLSCISDSEASLQVKLSNFSRDLSYSQQLQFTSLLQELSKQFLSLSMKCSIPSSVADLRRYYLDGRFSINNNIPRPISQMLGRHSIVSIKDCIADILGHGNIHFRVLQDIIDSGCEKEFHYPVRDLFGTVEAIKIINNCMNRLYDNMQSNSQQLPIIPILVVFWSDDFEPNSSIKSNRQSVWIKTVTFFFKCINDTVTSETYPLAIGKKDTVHDEVESRIIDELRSLKEGTFTKMYSSYKKQFVSVHAETLCILNDQPERRSSLGLAAGNGKYHARWGYSCEVKKLQENIRACKSCMELIRNEVNLLTTSMNWRLHQCDICSKWWFDDVIKVEKESITDNDSPMNDSFKIDLCNHVEVIKDIHNGIVSRKYNTKQAEMIMQLNCFSSHLMQKVLFNATNCLTFNDAYESRNESPANYASCLEDKTECPDEYLPFPPPCSWLFFGNTDHYVDVPMHLLFLGITKTLVNDVAVWLKSKNNHTRFQKLTSGILEEVQALQLPWCKVMPYSKTKFGGWISENYLGFCRLSNWFYTLLHYVPEECLTVDPTKNYLTWNRKECYDWLSRRGCDTSGNFRELKDRVSECMTSDAIPEVLPTSSSSTNEVLSLINTFSTMIAVLMKESVDDEKEIIQMESLIRLFLDEYSSFVDTYNQRKLSSWASHYNFLSLLNIPNQVRRYGPLRLLWEGGTIGEGYLRNVKSELKIGLNKKWQLWLMDNLLLNKAYDSVIGSIMENDNDMEKDNVTETKQKCSNIPIPAKIYSSIQIVGSLIFIGKPFSGLVERDTGQISILYRQDGNIFATKMYRIRKTRTMNFLNYYNVENCISPQHPFLFQRHTDEKKYTGILFLPLLSGTGYPTTSNINNIEYTIITSDWGDIDDI